MRTDLDHLPLAKQRELERQGDHLRAVRGCLGAGGRAEEKGTDRQDHLVQQLCTRRLGRRAAYNERLSLGLRSADHRQLQEADGARRLLAEAR